MKKKEIILAVILSIVACVAASFLVTRDVNINLNVEGAPVANQTVQQPAAQPTTQPATAPTQAPTEAPTQGNVETPEATEPSKDAAASTDLPSGNEAILKKYSDILNDANEKKVGYNKVEFQAIPPEKANLGGVLDKIMPVAQTFFVDEATAKHPTTKKHSSCRARSLQN